MPKIKAFLLKLHAPIWLGILVAVVLILRIPSFFEPYYYGDEMVYLTLGQGIRAGVPLYSGLHDNKPPLIYLLAALAGNLFWFKTILAAFNVTSIILFWNLVKALFNKNERLVKIATIVFGLATTLPLLEGNTVNAELLMIAPTIGAFWLLLRLPTVAQDSQPRNIFLAGLLFSLAALFKIPAAFDFPVIIVFWLLTRGFKLKNALYLTLGFLLPLSLSFVWFLIHGAGWEYLTAAFLQNFGYVSSLRTGGNSWGNFFLGKELLIIRALIVFLASGVLFIFRKKLSKQFIFISLWLFFSLFAVTLSERPYPHYLVQAIPAFSLLVGILVADKTLEQSLTVIPLAIFFFVPNYYHFWSYPTLPYYQRFVKFAAGKYSREEYFSQFDAKINTNYKIAGFLRTSSTPKDKVFVWGGDSPTVYALARRFPPIKYVADYHVFDYSTLHAIAKEISLENPKFIVFLRNSRPYPELREFTQKNYLLIDNTSGAEIWVKPEK